MKIPKGVRRQEARVLGKEPLGGGYLLLTLEWSDAGRVSPGQFVMVDGGAGEDPLLRRPISVQSIQEGKIDLLIKVVGRGTVWMSECLEGQPLGILGPLGTGWSLPSAGEHALLLGGGVGIAPLVALADSLDQQGRPWTAFLGVAGSEQVGAWCGFEGRDGVHRATLDGSHGTQGTVLDALLAHPLGAASIRAYACGPTPMLVALAQAFQEAGWPGQVSVETPMGCGLGLCMGCAVRGAGSGEDRWRLACVDGPVFDHEAIVLEDTVRSAFTARLS